MNSIKDLVSIVMPVFNAQATLKTTIESVMNQSYKNWELILVNDASSDHSAEIAHALMAKDKRILWVELIHNAGAAKSRNLAIDKARGQYIAFLDSDDVWDSKKLDKQLKFMKENAYAFTFTAFKTSKGRIFKAPEQLNYKQLIINNSIGCLTVIIDRNLTGEFLMPDYRRGQDHLTWLMLMERGNTAYGLNEVLATYTVGNTTSLSGNKIRSARRQWFNYRHVLGLPLMRSIFYFIGYTYTGVKKHWPRL